MWKTISDYFPQGTSPLQREERLTSAYRAVFSGSPTQEDQQIVLAHMLATSGFAQVSPSTLPANELIYREGMRAHFMNVYAYLTLSHHDINELHNAARREAALMLNQE